MLLSNPICPPRQSPWLNPAQGPSRLQHQWRPNRRSAASSQESSRGTWLQCALRGICPLHSCASRSVSWSPRRPPRNRAFCGAGPAAARNDLSFRGPTARRLGQRPAAPTSQHPACGLTLRSAPTHYGRPACPCGALVYAAPRGQAVLPPRSGLARTLGLTNSHTKCNTQLRAPHLAY